MQWILQRSEEQKIRLDLEEEVIKLQGVLNEEQNLNRVLQCALHRPLVSCPCHSLSLPLQVQVILAEVAMVEEEIICLERKVEELKLHLYQEKQLTKEWKLQQQQHPHQRHQKNFLCGLGSRRELGDFAQSSRLFNPDFRNQRLIRERKSSLGSASEMRTLFSTRLNDEEAERSSRRDERKQNQSTLDEESSIEMPNKLSEKLLKCLISIFVKLNRTPTQTDFESSSVVPKLTLSCMSSKGFMTKTPLNCRTPVFYSDDNRTLLDPYSVFSDLEGTFGDVGPYKNFMHFTRSSLDMTQVSQCFSVIGKLRVLMHKLCYVDLTLLTHKQKLAFWINTYNSCIMHAFLQHGLPSTPDKLLALMNKAALNVGGIVLNALAIEHFILRHPFDSKNGVMDEKEALLRHAYGLGYPEPNITFALCRGSWSSPALRIYTAENVMSELERAKVEYLEASIGFTCKKKIVVPKLLHWHMRDFAEDYESLLEWIYSQLPVSASLKRLIMEFLNGETKLPIAKTVDIQPYESEFRYLLTI
ncbi:ternary complex factor MIP1 leucine-zipper protein (Protein of unknown function, DUF547) isoform X2 [Tasmannia lanceolata]|uniref:ternary complex factor MIP1 leucine-zipper protein (Protein of unknown function, DUF547) isoform X2 n=1 Tax=Tasmannia lanceolata TaxID=3420 RepID=UPI004062EFA7